MVRAEAYLGAFLDGATLDVALAELRRRRRWRRSVLGTLRVAHLVLRRHARVSPEAAAVALVAEAGTSVEDAAGIVGIDRARLRLLVSSDGSAGRSVTWVGASPVRRDLLWPGVATVWLVVLALAVVPGQGVARGPALLLAQPQADLALSAVTASRPSTVQPGGDLHVAVAVMNGGSDDAEDVNVRVEATAALSDAAGTGTLRVVGGTASEPQTFGVGELLGAGVTVERIPAGSAAQLEADLAVPEDVADGTELGLVARIEVPAFGELESARAVSTVRRQPVLQVELRVTPAGPVTPGDQLTWTVDVRNAGSTLASSVSVHGQLPAGLRYVDGSATVDGAPPPPSSTDNGSLGVMLGEIAPGGARTASFQTSVSAEAAGDVLEYQVRAVHAGADEPATSGTVRLEVGMGTGLADTGLQLVPALALALTLLLAGSFLLGRPREQA